MGNAQPHNRTGRKATAQKLENAKKLGILSLSEHTLDHVPSELFQPSFASKLRTLDLSNNKLTVLGDNFAVLNELKSLNLDYNQLTATTMQPLSQLIKLQTLSLSHNQLGGRGGGDPAGASTKKKKQQPTTTTRQKTLTSAAVVGSGNERTSPTSSIIPSMSTTLPFPPLPVSLKVLNLSFNSFSAIPESIFCLVSLEKLDLSSNQLSSLPDELFNHLTRLQELVLDHNGIVFVPASIGKLTKLKALSLEYNRLQIMNEHDDVAATTTDDNNDKSQPAQQQQPLPRALFIDTLLIDLNLQGNVRLTNTQLNDMDGFQTFLDRRQKVKSKTFSNLSVCGLN